MSFVPGFAPDAQSQWRELDTELQELVLDEMERLVANPPRSSAPVVYSDLFHATKQARHYIFLRSTVDHLRRKVTIIGIVHVEKPNGA
jgi:hypothetical protein